MKLVKELKLEKAETSTKKSTQQELASLMKETDARHVFILEKGKLQGLVSSTDIIHAIAEDNSGSAEAIMAKEIISVDPEDSAGKALKTRMNANQYTLPVVKDERLHGVLTLSVCLGGLNDS